MKRLFQLIWIDIYIMIKDKSFYFWVIVFPMIFILIFGNIYKDDSTSQPHSELMVINNDSGDWGKLLVKMIKSEDIDINIARQDSQDFRRVLIIPASFSVNIINKKASELIFKTQPDASIGAANRVRGKIIRAITKLVIQMIISSDSPLDLSLLKPLREIVTIKEQYLQKSQKIIPSGFNHVIPGIIVQMILMMVFIYGAAILLYERQKGILSRVSFSSLSVAQIWSGKCISRVSLGIIQAFILIIIGTLVFHLDLGNPVLALLIILFMSLSVSSMSLFLGSVLNKEDLIIAISILTANIFAALGGCWWPIEVVPPFIRSLGMISPAYWAMDGMHKIIFFKGGITDLIPNFVVFFVYFLIFSLLSWKFFKIKENQ